MDTIVIDSLKALASGLKTWRTESRGKQKAAEQDREGRKKAVGEVLKAVVATTAYVHDRDNGEKSRSREAKLAMLWQTAAMDVDQYDHALYVSARLKAMGWADPAQWKRAEGKEALIQLDLIEQQCNWLLENS